MMRWSGGSEQAYRSAETDLRVGGRFHVGFKGETGEQQDVSGTYKEVVPNRKLVFSWAWPTTPERGRRSPSTSSPTPTARC